MEVESKSLFGHHTLMLSFPFPETACLGFEELWFLNIMNPTNTYTLPPPHTHSQSPLPLWLSPLLAGRSDRAFAGPFPPN